MGKKKGKKGKGKGKAKAETEEEKAAQVEKMTHDFDVYAAKNTIGRLENTNKELTHKGNELQAELAKTKAEQADVYIYLNKKLDDNFDIISTLETKLEELAAAKEHSEAQAARDLEAAQVQAEKVINSLQQRLEVAQDSLEGLMAFKEKKEEIENKLARSMADLADERALRLAQVAELERRNVAAKDKLKKEMFLKIKETKQNILESTNDQLDAATKRTMAENEQMTTELQYQSRETEKLLAKNASLVQENASLRREHELAEATQQQLVKRTHFYQRLIKKLHERIKVAEENVRRPRSPPSEAKLLQETKSNVEELKTTIADLDDELRHTTAEVEVARGEARHAVAEYQRVVKLQDETVNFLLQAVDDVKRQITSAVASGALPREGLAHAPSPRDGGMPVRLDRLTGPLRERALQLLLAKMQLFQTTMWAGTGTPTTATMAAEGAVPEALPPIPGAAHTNPPMSPMTRGRRASSEGKGEETVVRSTSTVATQTDNITVPTIPTKAKGSNPFAKPSPAGRRKFKASAMRNSSSLPSYPPAAPEASVGSLGSVEYHNSVGSSHPQRPRKRNYRPRLIQGGIIGAGGPSGTGFSHELSGRRSASNRIAAEQLTSISVTGQRRQHL